MQQKEYGIQQRWMRAHLNGLQHLVHLELTEFCHKVSNNNKIPKM